MAEEKMDKKMEEKKADNVESKKVEEKKMENKADKNEVGKSKASDKDKKEDSKKEDGASKKEAVKKDDKNKKAEAVINGKDVRISTKQAVAVCNFIRNKNIDRALGDLEEVRKMKRAIPMKGEIPHRKGSIMSGRYMKNATGEFIGLLKGLKANATANELELEKVKIFCMANVAARPRRRFGRKKFKRTHVQIKLIPSVEIKDK